MADVPAGDKERQLYPGESLLVNDVRIVIVAGSFELNGAADVINVRGKGFKVNRTGVGVFDVTFGNAYPMFLGGAVSVQGDTANTLTDLAAQFGTYTASTGLLEIFTYDLIATVALDDEDGPRVSFVAMFYRDDGLKVERS